MKDKVELGDLWPLIDEVISKGGEFKINPNGVSMLPVIRPGRDSVTLILPLDLKKGDIVLYRRDNDKFVLHRIMSIKNDRFIMCGDNQKVIEYGITKAHILAKVKDIYIDGAKLNQEGEEYKKYIKCRLKKLKWLKLRYALAKIKHKIFK